MKREIKFRGLRDTEEKRVEMVYGNLLVNENTNCVYFETHPHRITWREDGAYCSAPIRKGTAGQFTGLKDKNGREIYEGDIVKSHGGEEWNSTNEVVELDFETASFAPFAFNDDGMRTYAENSEVIGNIHENPEIKI